MLASVYLLQSGWVHWLETTKQEGSKRHLGSFILAMGIREEQRVQVQAPLAWRVQEGSAAQLLVVRQMDFWHLSVVEFQTHLSSFQQESESR